MLRGPLCKIDGDASLDAAAVPGSLRQILADDFTYPHVAKGTATVWTTLQVSVTQAIQIWPRHGAQPLHRDDYLHHRRRPRPDSQVQVPHAATDFTAQNGATLVVPGSHLWDDARRPRPRRGGASGHASQFSSDLSRFDLPWRRAKLHHG